MVYNYVPFNSHGCAGISIHFEDRGDKYLIKEVFVCPSGRTKSSLPCNRFWQKKYLDLEGKIIPKWDDLFEIIEEGCDRSIYRIYKLDPIDIVNRVRGL